MAYRTTSLPLASYLCTRKDIKFIGANTEIPVAFIFEPEDKVKQIADDFFTGKTTCNPLEAFQHYQNLKNLVFEVKRRATTSNIKRNFR